MNERGAIRTEDAYALGKMLDNSAWAGCLPRSITPSDMDLIFDNGGHIIFGEMSSTHTEWNSVDRGQLILYENAIKDSPHCAALCKHSVRPEENRPIDTHTDVTGFQLMLHDYGFVFTPVYQGNQVWQNFVLDWFSEPLNVRRKLISKYGLAA